MPSSVAETSLIFGDIESLLLVLGVEYDHITIAEIKAICPFHSESKPSFRIIHDHDNEKFGVYFCHGCREGGNIFTLVSKLLGTEEDPVDYLARFTGVNPEGQTAEESIKQILAERERIDRKPKVKGYKYDPRRLAERVLKEYCRPVNKGDAGYKFLRKRGLTGEEIERQGWLIAYKKTRDILEGGFPEFMGRRVVLPIGYNTGERTYFARLMPNLKGPKTLMAPGDGMRDPFLYPMPTDWKYKTVFPVEGPFDAIRLNRLLGEDAIAVSILGSAISSEQVQLIAGMQPEAIVTIPDADAGGDVLLTSARVAFSSLKVDLKRARLPKGCDPDDCPEPELLKAIDPTTWVSLYANLQKKKIKVGYNNPLRRRKGL